MSHVVTRFAPSPSGALHIGSARTALFNYLFTRHVGGQHLIRIDDTNQNIDNDLSLKDSICNILESLDWLGFENDGPIVKQSERIDRHLEVAHMLLDTGKARREGEAIIFHIEKEGVNILDDIVFDSIHFANKALPKDIVLVKSDGSPTYMLASVVDDYDMNITHVIRGEDHLTNTFKHINILKALDWPIPRYGHLPLIFNNEGKKLSKRDNVKSVLEYKTEGLQPDALCSYLMRLGWANGDDVIISMEEAIQTFELNKVRKSPARFDENKLWDVNKTIERNKQ